LVTAEYRGRKDWYASYLGTYLDRDLRMVKDIGNLVDFQTLVRLLAARTGQELNASSLGKRLIKRPKVYFCDTGLVAALCGIGSLEQWEGSEREFWYYRDNTGQELDLMSFDKSSRALDLYEIKAGMTPKAEWTQAVDKVAEPPPKGVVLRRRGGLPSGPRGRLAIPLEQSATGGPLGNECGESASHLSQDQPRGGRSLARQGQFRLGS
jgi:predicted AAA+ superfamily ATPase